MPEDEVQESAKQEPDPFDDAADNAAPAAPHVDESAPAGQARRVPDVDPPF